MSQNRSILVVDDEADFREIFSTKLKSAGFDVRTAASGEEAIAAIKSAPPELLLLDMKMPGMSGADVALALRDDPTLKGLKVVFLSNYGDPEPEAYEINRKFAREVGAYDYIKKIDDLDTLVERVQAFFVTK